jgi:hypothetical protein
MASVFRPIGGEKVRYLQTEKRTLSKQMTFGLSAVRVFLLHGGLFPCASEGGAMLLCYQDGYLF